MPLNTDTSLLHGQALDLCDQLFLLCCFPNQESQEKGHF